MGQTQVILVEMPLILREIVREVVSNQPDLAVLNNGDGALKVIQSGTACVAITHLDDPAPQNLARLLGTRPQVRVIALSADGRQGTAYDLQLLERPLGPGELCPAELLAAIRQPLSHPLGGSTNGGD